MSEPRTLIALRWEEGRYGSQRGYVGSVKTVVATVGFNSVRPKNEPASYYVRVDLPGFRDERKAESLDQAKAIAAACVNKFLRLAAE